MIKLIAAGNRCMKDDGAAVKAAGFLEEELSFMGIDVIICETDCEGCFYSLDETDFIIVLDASFAGGEPGSLHVFRLEEILAKSCILFARHDMGILELMKIYGRGFHGCFIGIEISEIGFGTELSPVLKERMPKLCLEIRDIVKRIVEERFL